MKKFSLAQVAEIKYPSVTLANWGPIRVYKPHSCTVGDWVFVIRSGGTVIGMDKVIICGRLMTFVGHLKGTCGAERDFLLESTVRLDLIMTLRVMDESSLVQIAEINDPFVILASGDPIPVYKPHSCSVGDWVLLGKSDSVVEELDQVSICARQVTIVGHLSGPCGAGITFPLGSTVHLDLLTALGVERPTPLVSRAD